MNKINNLDEAILNIGTTKENNKYGNDTQNDILYSRWKTRYAETIGAFYADFIKPRLPETEVICEWNDMLIKYSKMPGAVFPIRGGYSKKDEMRRGWLVRVNGGIFSYTFVDNHFPAYIYKMALDGFCPELDEFYEYMTGRSSTPSLFPASEITWLNGKSIENEVDSTTGKTRHFMKMPVSYDFISSSETVKNVYINTDPAPTCPLGEFGYKHAHIFGVRGEYEIVKGDIKPWKGIKGLIALGNESNYTWKDDINNYAWDRTVEDREDELRRIVVAHFLRLCDPINHFLSPDSGYNKFTEENGDYSLDIGEYDNLLLHLMSIREKEFGNDYEEFKVAAMASTELKSADRSTDIIHVVYHEKTKEATNRKNKEDKKKETSKKEAEKEAKRLKKEADDAKRKAEEATQRAKVAEKAKKEAEQEVKKLKKEVEKAGKSAAKSKVISSAVRSDTSEKTSRVKTSSNVHSATSEYSHTSVPIEKALEIAAFYLRNQTTCEKLDEKFFGIMNGHGVKSWNILKKLGIDTSRSSKHKGMLMHVDIDDAISGTHDLKLKKILEEIKRMGI